MLGTQFKWRVPPKPIDVTSQSSVMKSQIILQVLTHLQYTLLFQFGQFCLFRDMDPMLRTYITLLKTFIYNL